MSTETDRRPTVSVFIPAYNAAGFIEETLRSLLAQTWRDYECVISDDSSTDTTWNVVQALVGDDARFRLFRQERNLTMTPNWNFCLRQVRGKYVTKLDADDLWEPEYLAKCVQALENEPDLAFVFAQQSLFGDPSLPVDWLWPAPPKCFAGERLTGLEVIDWMLGHDNFIHSSAVMWRADLIARAGLFDETLPGGSPQDMEMWLRLGTFGDARCIPGPLTRYRMHPQQSMASEYESGLALWHWTDAMDLALKAYHEKGLLDTDGFTRRRNALRTRCLRHYLGETELQVFWSAASRGFNERQSLSIPINNGEFGVYESTIPLDAGTILRIDPTKRPGLIRIEFIELWTDRLLARWSAETGFHQLTCSPNVLPVPEVGRLGLLALTDDPQLYLNAQGLVPGPTQARLRIGMELRDAYSDKSGELEAAVVQTVRRLQANEAELQRLRQASAAAPAPQPLAANSSS